MITTLHRGGTAKWLQYYIGGGMPKWLQYYIGGGMPKWLQYYIGGGVSRDPQKWLRNMCTTPYLLDLIDAREKDLDTNARKETFPKH